MVKDDKVVGTASSAPGLQFTRISGCGRVAAIRRRVGWQSGQPPPSRRALTIDGGYGAVPFAHTTLLRYDKGDPARQLRTPAQGQAYETAEIQRLTLSDIRESTSTWDAGG